MSTKCRSLAALALSAANGLGLTLLMSSSVLGAQQLALGRETKATRPRVVDGIDLVPTSITLTSANQIAFTMTNAGRSAVTQPFVSDIYINGVRKDTYKHLAQGAQSDVPVVSNLARVDSCAPVSVMIVSDAQQVVAEANEANNTQTTSLTPKCPDLAVTEIKQDWQDLNTRYRIQVKVVNLGTAPMSRSVIARAWGGPIGVLSGLDVGAWPIFNEIEVKPLAPNQTTTFHIDGTFLGTDAVAVRVYLDFFHQIVETRVDNNLGTKTFGPH